MTDDKINSLWTANSSGASGDVARFARALLAAQGEESRQESAGLFKWCDGCISAHACAMCGKCQRQAARVPQDGDERAAFEDYRRGLMEAFHAANMINANRQGRTAEETCSYLVRSLAELANGGAAHSDHSGDGGEKADCRDTCDVCWGENGQKWPCAKKVAEKSPAPVPQEGDCTCGATGNTVHSERCPVTHMVRAAFAASGESATAVAGEVGEREGPTGDQLRAIIKSVGSIGTNHADAPTEYVLAGWQAALASNKAAAVATGKPIYQVWDVERWGWLDVEAGYYAERLPSNRRIVYATHPAAVQPGEPT